MFRRDPLRVALLDLGEMLELREENLRAARPWLRVALRRGGVLGAARGGRVTVRGLGGVPERGVFELASVTKPFTAALAGALVREGQLDWDRPLSALRGPFRAFAPFVTPRALATHTAGLPPHPARTVMTVLTRFHDPYGGMSPGAALASARRWANRQSSGRFGYSNLGVGVLALALAHAAGEEVSPEGYGRALAWYVTGPLGLGSVTLNPDPRRVVTPTAGLLGQGVTGFGPLTGAGGLFGTAADLLAFGTAQLEGLHAQGRQRPPGLPPGVTGVAPGWFITGSIWWHDGVARGTRTALALRPSDGTVLTLLVRGGLPVTGRRGVVPGAVLTLLGARSGG